MNTAIFKRKLWMMVAAISLGSLGACSGQAPEERLIAVGQDVSDVQARIQVLNKEITEHESAIKQLRMERQSARASLLTLEERLQKRASDLAIFRAVQMALLNEPQLQQSVVTANVEDAIVTITGTVSNAREIQIAKEIVQSVPGVASTVVRLEINEKNNAERG